MPPDEFTHWLAYFSIKAREEKEAIAKAEAKNKAKSGPRSPKGRRR